MINSIINKGQTLAIILRTTYKEKGINFFTPNEFSQQLAYMNHPSGYDIQPHLHNVVQREVQFTKEVCSLNQERFEWTFMMMRKTILKVEF